MKSKNSINESEVRNPQITLLRAFTEFTKSALHQAKFITKRLKKFEQISTAKTLFGRSFKVKEKNRSTA